MDMCLPNIDIYQDAVAPNRFKSHTLDVLIFVTKNSFV